MAKPPPAEHLNYAERVVDGTIRASQAVIARCRITLAEHQAGEVQHEAYGRTHHYRFMPEKIQGKLRFISLCPHPAGRWRDRGECLVLQPWQRFFVSEVFGWRDADDPDVCRFRRAHLFVSRKNGKTALAAALGLHEIDSGDAGAEVYIATTKGDQSKILFRSAGRMIEGMQTAMKQRFVLRVGDIEGLRGILEPLPAKPRTQDGYNPSLAIFDEAAAVEDGNQFHVLQSGMGARLSPLSLYISTAQPVEDSPYKTELDAARKGLLAGRPDPEVFALIYELDANRAKREKLDRAINREIAEPENWLKANPNLGVSISHRQIAEQLAATEGDYRQRNLTICKQFNCFTGALETWIPLAHWTRLQGEIDRRGPLYVGIDMAETTDLASACLLWDTGGGRFACEWKFWCPADALGQYPDEARAVLDQAQAAGSLEVVEGHALDLNPDGPVDLWMQEVHLEYDVVKIAYDPRFMRTLWRQRGGGERGVAHPRLAGGAGEPVGLKTDRADPGDRGLGGRPPPHPRRQPAAGLDGRPRRGGAPGQ